MLITYTDYLCVVFVCVCPGEGNVAFNATPNPFHLNKICLNQNSQAVGGHVVTTDVSTMLQFQTDTQYLIYRISLVICLVLKYSQKWT